MYLQALANRVPPRRFTQPELWEIYKRSESYKRLLPRSIWIVDKVLNGDSGIETRHFCLEDVALLPEFCAETLNKAFEREAPLLASAALEDALTQANLKASDLDALVVCTCTGYICPGVASHVAQRSGMRSDAFLVDIVGQGCGAAVPSIRNACGLVAADPEIKVAVIAVEVCSAAFYIDNDPGVLVSACLFGDGASASIWGGDPGVGIGLKAHDFDTMHAPEDREILRFENSGGKLRNQLDRCVPVKAAEAVKTLYDRSLQGSDRPVRQMISHAGGRDVVLAIEDKISGVVLDPTREVLRTYGNMSSPSVLFALGEYLQEHDVPEGEDLWLTSFGAGFAAHSFRLAGR